MATKYLDKIGLAYFWSKIKAWCSSIFVSKTGDQSIEGQVTLDSTRDAYFANSHVSGLYIRNSEVDRGTFPETGTKYTQIVLGDREGELEDQAQPTYGRLGLFEHVITSSNKTYLKLSCYNYINEWTTTAEKIASVNLYLGYDADGNQLCETVSTSENRTNGGDVLTRDWIPKDTRIVHTINDETISGLKTFTNTISIKNENITRGTAPSVNKERILYFYDSAGNKTSALSSIYFTDKSSRNAIYAYNTTVATGNNNIGYLGIGCDKDGNVFTCAPTPVTSSNDTNIATTAYVKAQNYLTGIVAVADGGTGHGERLTETTATDFNDYITTGEYHVRFSVNTLNRPYAYTDYRDCILTVSNITPSSNVSSYYRTLQTAIVLNPTVDKHPTMFIRKRYSENNGNWSDWYQVSYVNDSPEAYSKLAINLDTISTIPSTDTYAQIYQCRANDDKLVADMYIGRSTLSSGYTSTVLRSRCSDGISTNHAYFHLWCNADGTSKYSTTSAVFDSTDNSDKIPTTSWIRTATGNTSLNAATATKLAAAKTINGVSFDGSANITVADSTKLSLTGGTLTGNLVIKNSNVTKGTAPSSNVERLIRFSDSADHKMGALSTAYYTDKSSRVGIYAYNTSVASSESNIGYIAVGSNADGSIYTYAPNPASSSNDNSIATTKWVTNKAYITSSSNITGTAANVTGTVAIANGGTGATTRLNALKALTNENVGTNATYFLTITNSWGKGGYSSLADTRKILMLQPTYSDKRTDTTVGFDDFVETGQYHINFSNTTANCPFDLSDYTDGILVVYRISAAGNVSSYPRILQIFYTCGYYQGRSMIYRRQGRLESGNYVWGPWIKLIDNSPNDYNNYLHYQVSQKNTNFILANYSTLSSTQWSSLTYKDTANVTYSGVYTAVTSTYTGIELRAAAPNNTGSYAWFAIRRFPTTNTDKGIAYINDVQSLSPYSAGINLGANATANRWNQIYATNTTISTSDERVKQQIKVISDDILDVWEEVNWVQFKFNDSVKEKGLNARLHTGLIAQQLKNVFTTKSIDISKYGMFCYDEWDAQETEFDENGNTLSEAREAGNIYSIRYEEALCMEAAYQRRKNKILENRISELEKQVSDMIILLQNLTNGNG